MITDQHKSITLELTSGIEHRAGKSHLNCTRDDILKNETLFSRAKQASDLKVEVSKENFDLPLERHVLLVANYTVLVIAMTFSEDTFQNDYESAIWWSALVRSNLKSGREDDLHLFVVAPPNSATDSRVRFLSEWIEQDERFCRKLVWLPKADRFGETLQDFIDRTFLSRPWELPSDRSQVELDAVSSFLKRTSHESIDINTISDWLAMAGRGDLVGRDLVTELLRLYEQERGI